MTVTREGLYEQVWAEPMTTVAARYGVSSSFLARICARLKVPRPSRGYWQQREVGKGDEKPPLPAPCPGDEIEWSREGPAKRHPRELSRADAPARASDGPGERREQHKLLVDVCDIFGGAKVLDTGHLRPSKRRLVDVFVTKEALSRALEVANVLFKELESRGHQVTLDHDDYLDRPDVDIRLEGGRPLWAQSQWRPDRPTAVYVGTVAIGLTLFEFTEEVEVRWVNGKYVRVPENSRARNRGHRADAWVSKRDVPSGKLGLRASSPYPRTQWARQWSEAEGFDIAMRADEIARAIEAAAPRVAALVEEAHRKQEIERKQLEAQFAEWERKEEERRVTENLKESRDELMAAIDAWGHVRRIEDFFEDAERRASILPSDEADAVRERVRRARTLIGHADALERLRAWRAPEER